MPPVQSAHHVGLGGIRQSEPVWDLGAYMLWDPRMGARARMFGGSHPNFTYGYSGSTDPYTYLDPGKGRYIEVSGSSPVIPLDGHFATTRSNTYNTSDPDVNSGRGPFTIEAGLTLSTVAIPAGESHILATDGGGPATKLRLQNTTGLTRRIYRQETSSATLNKIWSVLARRTDGGTINGSTMTMGVSALADPLGSNIAGSTRYSRIRPDGWYQVDAILPPQVGAPDVYYWISFPNGVTVDLESPQSEGYSTSIPLPTPPILTAASPDAGNRNDHVISLAGGYSLPQSGWMGCTVIPHASSADVTYPTSVILLWSVDADNYHRFYISNSLQVIAYECLQGSVSQAFIQTQTADIVRGSPLGLTATWGHREGSLYFFACLNGTMLELDTAGTLPSGTAQVFIGSNNGSNVANVDVQSVALGHRAISRHDCRLLSRWFQKQARNKSPDMSL